MLLKSLIVFASAALCFANAPKYVRPCHLNHYNCIGNYMSSHSQCSRKIQGYVEQEYTIPRFRFETPYFNATYIDKDMIVRNHDKCFVSEFITNLTTNTTVLSLDCPWLNFESTRTMIQHRSYSEDTMYHYTINGSYPLIRLTTTFHRVRPINLCATFTYADVTELPIFHINPMDKPTANFLSRDLTRLNIFERETFFYRGPWLLKYFVNRVLCDFGCDQ